MPFLEATEIEGFGADFENAHPLWNAEVSFILDKYLETHNNQRNNPQNSMIQRTLEYVRKLNNYSTQQNQEAARALMKKGDKFTDYESALVNNLNIASVDEAITLIPSLKDKFPNTEALATRLAHLQDFQKSNDDSNYDMASYSALSQTYHDTGIVNPSAMNDEQKEDDGDSQMSGSPQHSPNFDANASQTPQTSMHSSSTPYTDSSHTPYSTH